MCKSQKKRERERRTDGIAVYLLLFYNNKIISATKFLYNWIELNLL